METIRIISDCPDCGGTGASRRCCGCAACSRCGGEGIIARKVSDLPFVTTMPGVVIVGPVARGRA